MAEKASRTAIIALCISIGTAGFSIYQWWNGQAEGRISAAIEISKNHLRDRELKVMASIVKAAFTEDNLSTEELLMIGHHADELEYVAFLANHDKIDKSYLSLPITCDIVLTSKASERLKQLIPTMAKSPEHQMRDFSRTAVCDLNSMVPPQSN